MTDVKLSLPQREKRRSPAQLVQMLLLVAILFSVLAAIAAFFFFRSGSGSLPGALSAGAVEDIALRLERGGLSVAAAEAWIS